MNTFQRTIGNDVYELQSLMHAMTNFLEDHGVEGRPVYRINLALEELITNTIKYGYSDYDRHEIHVSAEIGDERVVCVIEDNAREFNPLDQKSPELASVESRVGGLGIHIIRQMLDSMTYRREGRRNILEIQTRKNLPPAAA